MTDSNETLEFQEHELPLNERYYQGSHIAVLDFNITSDAHRLLCYLTMNSKTWVNYSRYMCQLFKWGKDRLTAAIRSLHNNGYIQRERVRNEKGVWKHYKYKYCQKPVFKNETWEAPKKRERVKPIKNNNANLSESISVQDLQPAPDSPALVKPVLVNQPLPMPNIPMPKLKALDKALPAKASSPKTQAMDSDKKPIKSSERIHPRKPDKEEAYQWLLGLRFGSTNAQISEKDCSFLAHSFSFQKLQDCFFHLQAKLDGGLKATNPIGLFRKLLKDEHNPITANTKINISAAKIMARDLEWHTLEFHEKYIVDKNYTGKEISFNMPPASFRESFLNLHASIR